MNINNLTRENVSVRLENPTIKQLNFSLSKPPESLEELGNSLSLLEKLKTGQDEIEGRFPPLYEQFNILRKHEVQVDEKVSESSQF